MIETVLEPASALARRHGAYIFVAHCRKRTEELRPYSRALPAFARATMLEQSQELAGQEEQDVRVQLHRFAVSVDIKETDMPVAGTASVEFVEEYGQMADVIRHNGCLADLVVVAKPDRDCNIGTNSLKSALYKTGRPVLMCPPKVDVASDFGAHIAVAWNGSLEATRAVAMTLDLAVAAQSVTVLSGGKREPHGATTDELLDYYRLRGVEGRARKLNARNPGDSLPKMTAQIGASLLVMSANGHNHDREVLFGENT